MQKLKSLPYTFCQNIVKEKNLISFCFQSNPYVCMTDNCIVLYKLVGNKYEPRSDRRDLLAIKFKSEIFTERKDLAVVNNYRKFEEIIFTNSKDMSV